MAAERLTENKDELILEMGNSITALHREIEALEPRARAEPEKKLKLEMDARLRHMQSRIYALEDGISVYRAHGVEAATLQFKIVVGHIEGPPRANRLAYSVLYFLENLSGISRKAYAGEIYTPDYCDPFQGGSV